MENGLQENFISLDKAYYKNRVCAFVIYNISKRESSNNVIYLEERRYVEMED